jgi:hypothetical protein
VSSYAVEPRKSKVYRNEDLLAATFKRKARGDPLGVPESLPSNLESSGGHEQMLILERYGNVGDMNDLV